MLGITTEEEIMDVHEKDSESLSDVATAFTIAFVGLCRALEQQHKMMPDTIAEAIHTELSEVPKGSKLHTAAVKEMVMNIAKAVNGARIAEVRIPQHTR
jgi:predicted secreted Zn-dependent protease